MSKKKSFAELAAELASIDASYAASHPVYAAARAKTNAAKADRERAEAAYINNPSQDLAEARASAYDFYEACWSAARTAYKEGH